MLHKALKSEQSRSNTNELPHYFEVTEEGRGVLQFALNVEGDHPRTSGALSLHQLMLGVRGQAYVERGKTRNSQLVRTGCFYCAQAFLDNIP